MTRNANGKFAPRDALSRFIEKCRFDPMTGCVLWTGGTSAGHGNSARYGVFWDDGRRHFAHRWSAIHIHKLPVNGLQVGHCCPCGPNTLCVAHVAAQTQLDNLAELHGRMREKRVQQGADTRQHWLFVQRGYVDAPPPAPANDPDAVPFHIPPAWLGAQVAPECPF